MQFEQVYNSLLGNLIEGMPVDRGEWHAKDVSGIPKLVSYEVRDVGFDLYVPKTLEELQDEYVPNLPWAEDHFKERVSGQPLNPPPSHAWWPFGNTETHMSAGKFSHSYPERYWPKQAGEYLISGEYDDPDLNIGIRFEYGDLEDLVKLLQDRPMTRQAYLPVWFPEDLTAANEKHRCPCSLGYHFLVHEEHNGLRMDCSYFMRSCDFVRHFRDDMYLTARLMQWVRDRVLIRLGDMHVYISSLHCMEGDLDKMREEYEGLSSA